ncbi:hypothetical protein KALB_6651 [Kutzneria albida DSM 43870]|uniref:Phosphoribosyltransferase domain-containing protein n=1 Tax=Kutzneria albida DSM 43870 TaxID=1449976 RepID=W5WGY7_9PSEU|nr:hypothetical protein KALB_6651 [Kutzneria albida DSM 43870]
MLRAWPRATRAALLPRHQPHWTNRVKLDFTPHSELTDFLKMLKRVLTLKIQERSRVDGAIALDFYSRLSDSAPNALEYTATADIVRTIKGYQKRSLAELDHAERTLLDSLTDVIVTHPWLSSADRILPVPGHAGNTQASASVRIGHALHRDLGIQLTDVHVRNKSRKPTKDMTRWEREQLLHEFRITEDLSDKTVLIVDDICHTGFTLAGVATAARQAGAATILGLVAARNFRR